MAAKEYPTLFNQAMSAAIMDTLAAKEEEWSREHGAFQEDDAAWHSEMDAKIQPWDPYGGGCEQVMGTDFNRATGS